MLERSAKLNENSEVDLTRSLQTGTLEAWQTLWRTTVKADMKTNLVRRLMVVTAIYGLLVVGCDRPQAKTDKSVSPVPTTAGSVSNNQPSQPNAGKTKTFVNSRANLPENLAQNYSDFSFQYPETWQLDPEAGKPGAKNFVKVERRIEAGSAGRFTLENFAVGWFGGLEPGENKEEKFKSLAKLFSDQVAPNFPEYKQVSVGNTKINGYDGYEFRFTSIARKTPKGDINLWGRVIFLPGNNGSGKGVILIAIASSLAPEVKGVADVGEKGELPVIFNSFKLGL